MSDLRKQELYDNRARNAQLARYKKVALYRVNTNAEEIAFNIVAYQHKLNSAPSEYEEIWLEGQIEINTKILRRKKYNDMRIQELLNKAEEDYKSLEWYQS